MKIKLKIDMGNARTGEIYDAVSCEDKSHAVFFDKLNSYWSVYSEQFEIVEEEKEGKRPFCISVRDLLGQDISEIKFK